MRENEKLKFVIDAKVDQISKIENDKTKLIEENKELVAQIMRDNSEEKPNDGFEMVLKSQSKTIEILLNEKNGLQKNLKSLEDKIKSLESQNPSIHSLPRNSQITQKPPKGHLQASFGSNPRIQKITINSEKENLLDSEDYKSRIVEVNINNSKPPTAQSIKNRFSSLSRKLTDFELDFENQENYMEEHIGTPRTAKLSPFKASQRKRICIDSEESNKTDQIHFGEESNQKKFDNQKKLKIQSKGNLHSADNYGIFHNIQLENDQDDACNISNNSSDDNVLIYQDLEDFENPKKKSPKNQNQKNEKQDFPTHLNNIEDDPRWQATKKYDFSTSFKQFKDIERNLKSQKNQDKFSEENYSNSQTKIQEDKTNSYLREMLSGMGGSSDYEGHGENSGSGVIDLDLIDIDKEIRNRQGRLTDIGPRYARGVKQIGHQSGLFNKKRGSGSEYDLENLEASRLKNGDDSDSYYFGSPKRMQDLLVHNKEAQISNRKEAKRASSRSFQKSQITSKIKLPIQRRKPPRKPKSKKQEQDWKSFFVTPAHGDKKSRLSSPTSSVHRFQTDYNNLKKIDLNKNHWNDLRSVPLPF